MYLSKGFVVLFQIFASLWAEAVKFSSDHGEHEVCSIVVFQKIVNDHIHMERTREGVL